STRKQVPYSLFFSSLGTITQPVERRVFSYTTGSARTAVPAARHRATAARLERVRLVMLIGPMKGSLRSYILQVQNPLGLLPPCTSRVSSCDKGQGTFFRCFLREARGQEGSVCRKPPGRPHPLSSLQDISILAPNRTPEPE